MTNQEQDREEEIEAERDRYREALEKVASLWHGQFDSAPHALAHVENIARQALEEGQS